MSEKKTGLIPVSKKPVRVGWYEVSYHHSDRDFYRRYWDGRAWRFQPNGQTTIFGNTPDRKAGESWRGLATKPKGMK